MCGALCVILGYYLSYERILEKIKHSYNIAGKNYYKLFHDDINKHKYDQQLLSKFLTLLDEEPIICDLGCGPAAQYSGFIKESCKEVHAVDISENNIKIAQEKHSNIKYHCSDMTKTEFKNNFFNGLLSFYSLFHIPKSETYTVFKEFYRILKPNGVLLLVTHKGNYENTFTDIWDHTNLSIFANFHMENEIEKPVLKNGFNIIDLYSKKAYYNFPRERIILYAQKPQNYT
jgi:ubiquinone/menaquinone biosynthesis C-methylase UbiE